MPRLPETKSTSSCCNFCEDKSRAELLKSLGCKYAKNVCKKLKGGRKDRIIKDAAKYGYNFSDVEDEDYLLLISSITKSMNSLDKSVFFH